ncbi:SDR family oxidoreductase [Catellatospora bangladeshensis]|uniref:LysR family transcriptional regulator n=1 Tax=Catellatospora bangladeshensis TaxID=310355 RepID=A0A8J3JP16_9ACTN|nr:SDR family oxidoreductase [Catellatospora bangladeshensis]GIF85934.1 LysR family transcriptional regulator [Catellatospora bangladeshensis]
MRIAVVGATGRIGSLTAAALQQDRHEVVPVSRTHGVDVTAGTGLDEALAGVAAVIDTTSTNAPTEAEAVGFFTTATANLLAAEQRAGVGHHVVLSIARVRTVPGNAHHAGKRAQEAAVEAGPIPYTIVPATQFHDFPATVAGWVEHDGVAQLPPLLMQPIAPADVAAILARIAVGAPQGRHRDIAGPETQDLIDMARRTLAVQGRSIRLVPTWHGGIFDLTMAGDALLPGADAEIAPTTFDEWLAAQRS